MTVQDEKWMSVALEEARIAFEMGEIPVGAVIVRGDEELARAHNLCETRGLATAHAEILCINKASKKFKSWRIENAEMYVTVEPCAMCAGAIVNARINKVYFGAFEHKSGCAVSKYPILTDAGLNHSTEFVGGVEEETCANLLKNYFKGKRNEKKA